MVELFDGLCGVDIEL